MTILLSEYTVAELLSYYDAGKKIEILPEEGFEIFFEVNETKLKEKVNKADGFRLADGHVVNWEDYTGKIKDNTNKHYLQLGIKDTRGIKKIKHEEFEAFIIHFGRNKMKLKKNIDVSESDIVFSPSPTNKKVK